MNNVVNVYTNSSTTPELILEMDFLEEQREPPPPYTATNSTVTNQPSVYQTVIFQSLLKSRPLMFTCPYCQKRELTKVKYVNSHATHMISGFICGCTLWCLLCCFAAIPYLLPTCKKAEHYCSNCDTFLGTQDKC